MTFSSHTQTSIKIIIVSSTALLLSGCPELIGSLNKDSDTAETEQTEPKALLKSFTTPDELEERIKKGMTQQYSGNNYERLEANIVMDSVAAPSDGGASTSESRVSTTNLQVGGVDEADRIKNDGQYLYIAQQPKTFYYGPEPMPTINIKAPPNKEPQAPETAHIRILQFSEDPHTAEEISKINFEQGEYITGTYLLTERENSQSDILITTGQYQAPHTLDWFAAPTVWQSGSTTINLINIDNPAQPKIKTTLQFDGHLVSSRRIGEMLYLVTRYNPYIKNYITYPSTPDEETENQKLLNETELADLLPQWSVGSAEKTDLLSPDHCYLAPTHDESGSADIVSIIAVDLTQPESKPNARCMVGPTETTYVSMDSMYLATTRHRYTIQPMQNIRSIAYPTEVTTEIHKFSLTELGPEYRGSGVVEGHLGWEQDKKSFRMGEHNGVLRIATSLGKDWDGSATTRLTLLGETEKANALALDEIAHLPNDARPEAIGLPGERLYATRFMGDRAYLVTFRVTDPLYVIDLSDPTDPFIAGSLKIPGYSDYLHPINDNLMLGLGKEAVADSISEWGDGRGAWYQGIKLALFDIADPSNPQELQSLTIGQRGTQSEALVDHHAFTWLDADYDKQQPAKLALPISLNGESGGGLVDPKYPSRWAPWTHTGLYLFNINDGSQGELPLIEEQGKLIVENSENTVNGYGSTAGDRAVIRGDGVHYIHDNGVWSASWADVKGTQTNRQ